ncbi:hypothetical protein LX64_00423 [Chitinophaga skermanii]|uniref:VOC domain-containing protein n=1 Tax=Chitinophaga skermanii TaxID=331697 RepID=A0A327R1Z7_9BACT|nr:VOC family protein [Chitinophaga skermanii]RAJ10816.1 hypothetical protein LX64_00423 [Chitinophaga skermanii]
MQIPKNAVNWVEIPVKDFERAKQFYNTIFQFDMPETNMGMNRMGFLLFDMQQGGVGAAIVQGADYISSQRGCLVYLNAGNDLSEVLDRIPNAGGKIELGKSPVSESQHLGYFAIFYDTEGNRLALHSME